MEKKIREFKTCIEYELGNGEHTFRCKGCNKDFPKSFNASRHANLCQKFQKEYVEDYEKFRNDITELYINKNLSIQEVSEILKISNNFKLDIVNKLDLRKSEELIKQNQFDKRKKTCLEKYGTEQYFGSKDAREKSKQTWIQKYGVDNPRKSEEVISKSKETCVNKYGVDHPLKSQEVKDKIKETNLKRYGVEYGLQLQEIKDKGYKTSLEKYGTRHPMQSEVVKNKVRQTNESRYGVKCPLQSEDVKTKIKETCMERYGVPYHCMTGKCIDAQGHIISKINHDFADYLSNEFNIDSEFEFHIGKFSYDIHILDTNILIEIDPTYTHNSTIGPIFGNNQRDPMDSNYHLMKTELARSNNYHCIHVFDWDDWTKIINLINTNKNRVYARNCKVKEVPVNECNVFLNSYHLQNTCRNQKVRYGLYNDDKLIQIMTFGKPRYNKNYQWELLRYCSDSDYEIIGGSSKLFKHFIDDNNPESIISYCDKSKFNGNVYRKLGFNFKYSTDSTPHWYNGDIHITDSLLRQRGFDQLFNTNYGKGTSNEELMIQNGFVKVYDCGQEVYEWNKI